MTEVRTRLFSNLIVYVELNELRGNEAKLSFVCSRTSGRFRPLPHLESG